MAINFNYKKGLTTDFNKMATQAQKTYQNHLKTKPGAYQSAWKPEMERLYNEYATRPDFKYDLNGDMLYQQMKEQYTRNGQMAMQDTIGQASAMTGGYGNSYAQSAGQQMYNQHIQALNDNIPALYDRKYQEYADQGQQLLSQYGLASDMEGKDYGQYRDKVGDWQTMLNHYYGGWQDQVGSAKWQEQFNYQQASDKYARDMAAAQTAAAAGRSGGGGRRSGGDQDLKLDFTDEQIDAAINAFQSGGANGLKTYAERTIISGKSAAQAAALTDYVINNYQRQSAPTNNSQGGR